MEVLAYQGIQLDGAKSVGAPRAKPAAAQCDGDSNLFVRHQRVTFHCWYVEVCILRHVGNTLCSDRNVPVDGLSYQARTGCPQAAWPSLGEKPQVGVPLPIAFFLRFLQGF